MEEYFLKDSDNTSPGRTQAIHKQDPYHDGIHAKTNREVYTPRCTRR